MGIKLRLQLMQPRDTLRVIEIILHGFLTLASLNLSKVCGAKIRIIVENNEGFRIFKLKNLIVT